MASYQPEFSIGSAETKTGSALYKALEARRQPFLDRARDCSKLTIPSVLPDESHNTHSKLPTPFQSLGARGVNNLSSKLLLTLLPPNAAFFRLAIDPYQLEQLAGNQQILAEIDESLGKMERAVMSEIETTGIRTAAFEALKHLLITGNALLYFPDEGGLRLFHMDSYVVERDPKGNLMSIVTKESIAPKALPQNVRELVQSKLDQSDKSVDIYTCVHRTEEGDTFETFQEIMGMRVPDSDGVYKEESMPYMALRLSTIANEDFGRGLVEEYMGDLRSLESLTRSIVEGSAAAAKVLFLVNPNGTTRARALAESPNGAIREGNAADVTTLQVNKAGDFRVALEAIGQIRERLMHAFLLNESIQRQAERVTAEEIRFMAQELEQSLGGIFSILSSDFQLPLVNILMQRMTKERRLPKLPKGVVRPKIVTGLEALGRGNDLNRLDVFISGAIQQFGPEFLTYINLSDYLTRRATAVGIDIEGLIKTEEEVAQQRQQAMMMDMAQKLGPNAINAANQQYMAQAQQPPSE